MSQSNSSPTKLRMLLLFSVAIMIAVIVGGFTHACIWLSDSASSTKTKNYANISGNLNNDQMINLQEDVNNNKANSVKATALIVPKKSFENIVNQDINKYATDIGIPVSGFGISQKPSFMTTDSPISGVEPQYVSISISSPVQFKKLLEFIQAIESNIPKMKITGINISSVSGQNGMVSVKPIIIEVYTQ